MGVSLMSLQITRALNDVTGNVAVIFAVLLVPIFALIALSIDLNTTRSNTSRIQTVLDSAAVSGARSRLEGVRGTDVRKDLIGFIESQTDPMPGLECETPVIIDAWWVHEVIVQMECWSGAHGPTANGSKDRSFTVQSRGYYPSDPDTSGTSLR